MAVLKSKSLGDWNFLIEKVCEKMGSITGNVMSEKQLPMIESRMRKRLGELKLDSPEEYLAYWKENLDTENSVLVSLLTTHFTSFFREFAHFEWISSHLPQLVANAKSEGRNTLYFWSAACSNGQEVWSLSMWLSFHLPKIDSSMNWRIFGTDISSESVSIAENGVYHRKEVETAPRHLWEGAWVKGKNEIQDWYKIKKVHSEHATFKVMNLLQIDMDNKLKFDVIMCRNVLIYFDRVNQEKIARSLLEYLSPAGALITGVSESLSSFSLPIKGVSTSVYQKQVSATKTVLAVAPRKMELPNPLKVFCIDDSGTVMTILKKILKTPGFEVIGTATNGEEAIEKLKTLKPDVITLDLHMPILDGPGFLKKSGIARSVPVVVVSSVSRDDLSVVTPLFSEGVCDFVEKPTLENISKIGEELLQKLKTSWLLKGHSNKGIDMPVPQLLKKKRERYQIILNFSDRDLPSLEHILKTWENFEDNFLFIYGTKLQSSKSLEELIKKNFPKVKNFTVVSPYQAIPIHSSLPTAWINLSGAEPSVFKNNKRSQHSSISEEGPGISSELVELSQETAPYTSIQCNLEKLLGGK